MVLKSNFRILSTRKRVHSSNMGLKTWLCGDFEQNDLQGKLADLAYLY